MTNYSILREEWKVGVYKVYEEGNEEPIRVFSLDEGVKAEEFAQEYQDLNEGSRVNIVYAEEEETA